MKLRSDILRSRFSNQPRETRSTVEQFNGATRNDRYQSKCRWTGLFIDNSCTLQIQIIRHIHNNIILFIDDLKSFRWRKIQSCLKEAKIEIWIVHIHYIYIYVALDKTFEDPAFKPDRCRRTIQYNVLLLVIIALVE